jgi:hypothetical protein
MSDELYRRFRRSAEEALDEADYADEDELEDLRDAVDEMLDRIDGLEERAETIKAENWSADELRAQLPDDLADEVIYHLTEPDDEEAVEKAVNGDFSPLTVAYRNERGVPQ